MKNKKNIFMLVNYFPNDESMGISKKIKVQIDTFRSMGYSVIYTIYTDNGVSIIDNNDNVVYSENFKTKSKLYNRLTRNQLLKKVAYKYAKENKFEYAYLRFLFFDKKYYKLLKELKIKDTKVIIEAHSYPVYKKGITIYTPVYIIDYFYSKLCSKYIDLVAAISDVKDIWGVKTIQIENGVDINRHKIHDRSNEEKENINLISVSYESEVHGNDRVIKGIYDYYQSGAKRDVKVYFVGSYMNQTINLVNKLGLQDKIIFTGKKFGKELDELYDKCDIGIGMLAPHRMNTSLRVSLKTREYLSRGIPFICSCDPLVKNKDFKYAMEIDSSDKAIQIASIIDFYNEIKQDNNMREYMRKYAQINYSWEKEFKKVFSILEESEV